MIISFDYKNYDHILILLVTSFLSPMFRPPHFLVRAQYDEGKIDNSNSTWNFNPLYMGVVAIAVIIFCTLLFYVIHVCCYRFSRLPSSDRTSWASGGLSPTILEDFPTFKYPENVVGLGHNDGLLECAVCLSPYEEEEILRLLPECYHVFHLHCVDRWLAAHTTCPLCRADLVPRLSGSSRINCIEDLEEGSRTELGEVENDTNESTQEIPNRRFWTIWRWNSTGHRMNYFQGVEEFVERFRQTS